MQPKSAIIILAIVFFVSISFLTYLYFFQMERAQVVEGANPGSIPGDDLNQGQENIDADSNAYADGNNSVQKEEYNIEEIFGDRREPDKEDGNNSEENSETAEAEKKIPPAPKDLDYLFRDRRQQ